MLPASTVPQSGQVLVSHHCRVSSMTYSLHLNRMIRQMVSRGLVYPLRVSRLTYTAPDPERLGGLEVDEQLELRRLLDGEIGGLGALEDLVHVGRSATI